MSKALSDLRTDMVTQAQEELKAHADKKQDETNVQKLIDKQTKDLTVRVILMKRSQCILSAPRYLELNFNWS